MFSTISAFFRNVKCALSLVWTPSAEPSYALNVFGCRQINLWGRFCVGGWMNRAFRHIYADDGLWLIMEILRSTCSCIRYLIESCGSPNSCSDENINRARAQQVPTSEFAGILNVFNRKHSFYSNSVLHIRPKNMGHTAPSSSYKWYRFFYLWQKARIKINKMHIFLA